MGNKASKSSMMKALSKYAEPLLVLSYKSAVQNVCERFASVSKISHIRFIVIQKQLDRLNVAYDRYAYTVVKSWWPWCQSKDMPVVPINLFCGKKAWDRFLEDLEDKPSVRLDTNMERVWSQLCHSELCVAQAYIAQKLCDHRTRLSDVRKQLRPILSSTDGAGNKQILEEVVDLLNMLHGCQAADYDGVVEYIR